MASISERLTALVQATAGTQKAFAAKTGLLQSAISSYATGRSAPGSEALAAVIKAFPNVNVRWLLTGEGGMLDDSYRVEYDTDEKVARGQQLGIPVVSRIRAGLGGLYEIEHHAETRLSMRPEDVSLPGDSPFGLVIEGDSMAPYMIEGDIVVCSPFRKFEVGDDVAVYRQATGESTVKRVGGHEKGSRRIKLQPLNPDYEPFVTTLQPGDQVAVVIALYRNLRDRKRRSFSI